MVYKRNVNEMEWAEMGHGERFHNERKMLTPLDQTYLPKLAVLLFRLRPGKRSFSFHEHIANDEAILVTRGSGRRTRTHGRVPAARARRLLGGREAELMSNAGTTR